MISYVFPTINGVAPNKSRVSKPYAEIVYTDTTFTVKQRPPKVDMYLADTINDVFESSISWSGVTPLVKFHYGKGVPPELAPNYSEGEYFGIHYQGKFAPNTGQTAATFYLRGEGQARITVGGSALATITLSSKGITASLHATGLSASNVIDIWYINPGKYNQNTNTFCVTWKDGGSFQPIPLSTGNFYNSLDDSVGINSYAIPYISNIVLSRDKKQAGKLTFNIPIVQSTASIGYHYVKEGDYFQHTTNSTIQIKKFRMVEFNTGYKYSDDSIATITKFVGQVRGWRVQRNTRGKSEAIVEVNDWSIFLTDKINEVNQEHTMVGKLEMLLMI